LQGSNDESVLVPNSIFSRFAIWRQFAEVLREFCGLGLEPLMEAQIPFDNEEPPETMTALSVLLSQDMSSGIDVSDEVADAFTDWADVVAVLLRFCGAALERLDGFGFS
jgi:hypothetical protein